MADPVVVGYGQNKWVKDANTRMLTLYTDGTAYRSSYLSGSTYQVPAGKKTVVLYVRWTRNSSNINTPILWDQTVADSATGTHRMYGATVTGLQMECDCYVEFAENHYIGQWGISDLAWTALAVEMDA